MAFDVYPQPPIAPRHIDAHSSWVVPLTQERRSAEATPAMYIRVAIIASAVNPTFALQAGAGDPVPVPSASGIWDQPGGVGHGNYVGDSYLTAESNGVYLIKVLLFLNTPSAWKLTITNNDPAATGKDFTFVVADSNADSHQPWIDTSTTLTPSPFEALVTETGAFNVRLFNKGTGPLSNLGGTLSGADAASFTFAPAAGSSINPNGFLDVPVNLLAINSPKQVNATLTVTSNDTTAQTTAGHNHQVTISGTIEQLEIGFMLDASGSMAFAPDGTSIIAINKNATRWGLLKSAVQAALTALGNHGAGKGTFGVGMYPDITPFPADPSAPYGGPFPVLSPSAADFQALAPITAANIQSVADPVNGALEKHFVREWGAATPMGAGIAHAIGDSAGDNPWGYFSNQSPGVDLNRRWMILMSDGNHNSSPPDPPDFYAGPGSFTAKKIKVITLGYGNTNAVLEPVNTTLMQNIAAAGYLGSMANYHFAQADATPALTVAFIKGLIFNALALDSITDPGGVLTSADPTVSRQVSVTQYDRKISFIVAWATYDAERLRVQVQTPLGELIEAPGRGYTVDENPRFRMLTFDRDFIVNSADPGKPRYGTWTLIITLQPELESPRRDDFVDSEPYNYQVIVDSRLKLRTQLNQTSYAPGDKIEISALLTLDGQGIPNAAVTLSRTIPANAHLNWLATSPVTAAEYNRAADSQQKNPDIDSLGIKQIALGNKGQRFTPVANSDVVAMVDAQGNGVYAADTVSNLLPGTYPYLATAVGALPDGTAFRREASVDIEFVVRPEPIFTPFQVDYSVVQQGGQTLIRAVLTVRPLDRFGNVVLIDPKIDPSVMFTASAGNFDGAIIDNHDGSYSRILLYPSGQPVTVGVNVGGNPVVTGVPLVPVTDLHFVNKVYSFHLGAEATPGANQHRDPAACLGNFTSKANPEFVSLGAGGSIVVGISGHYVAGHGDDDITVFVQPDEEPRPYAVDATHGDEDDDWFEIGQSPGVSQSFSLRHHRHLPTARAIRIRDRSGRMRNNDGTPSSSPGVSILAVGARRIERGDGDLDDVVIAWLRKLGHTIFSGKI